MLQIQNLKITHKKDLRVILDAFSFVLNPGDRAVIIGEEGNGKSTLLKWIYDPALIEDYAEAEGIRVCSGERLAYLPQELPAADYEKTIYEFFCEEEGFFAQTPRELGELSSHLHVPVDFFYGDQKMGTLSGGEKIKAQMARLLMGEPTVLLLDEPSNDIDIETLEWLEKLILESHQAILYISHDETLIERTANVVIHLEQIRRKTQCRYQVARTDYRTYLENRLHNFEKQEQEALNEKRAQEIREEKLQRIYQAVDHAQATVSRQDPSTGRLLKKKMKAVKSMEKRFEREKEDMTRMPEYEEAIFMKFGEDIHIPNGKMILEYELPELWTGGGAGEISGCSADGEHSMDGERDADGGHSAEGGAGDVPRLLAEDISLTIRGAQKVCIIGSNGAGKTTLLRRIKDQLLVRQDIHAAYMPQNYEELLDMEQTPVEFLSVTGDKEEITRIRTYLGSMKYTADEMSHGIRELSGGQRAKILLLKLSMSGADVLILDEPTRNFSPLSGPVIRQVLASYGGAILSISHDRKYIAEVCDQVYRLTPGGLEPVAKDSGFLTCDN